MTLTDVQVAALNSQVAGMTDEELVAFYEANEEMLEAEGAEDVIEKAAEAHDRIQIAKAEAEKEAEETAAQAEEEVEEEAKPKLTEEERRERNRAKLAETFRQNGFLEAGDAVESDIQSLSGFDAAKVKATIAQALRQGGARRGKENWEKVGWALFHQARVRSEEASENQVLVFLMPIIRVFRSLTAADYVSESILRGAEIVLKATRPSEEWAQWAIDGLNRLIASNEANPVNTLLREDPELAQKADEAEELIDCLQDEVRGAINRHRDGNVQRKQAKDTARRGRQLQRAKECRGMRGSHSENPLEGKGKNRPRSASDPHRHGKK